MTPTATSPRPTADSAPQPMSEAARRLTPLAVMLLALLTEDDMHPYEMKRLLHIRHDDRLVKITNGTLYHTVARLAEAGLVRELGVDRDGNRPERTTYAVTDAGRQAVAEWVRHELRWASDEPRFRVALSEAHNLDRDETVAQLTGRRDAIAADLRQTRAGLAKAAATGVPAQYLIEIERDEALAAADLAWIDSLITRLRTSEFPWASEDPARRQSPHYLAQRKAARQ